VGIPSWLSPSGHTNGLPYTKEIFGLVAMMPDNLGFSLLHERINLALAPVTCNKSLCVYQYTML